MFPNLNHEIVDGLIKNNSFKFKNGNPEKVTDGLIPKGHKNKKSFNGSCDCIQLAPRFAPGGPTLPLALAKSNHFNLMKKIKPTLIIKMQL